MISSRNVGPDQPAMRCSFCNKAQNEVRTLVAGQAAFICDECVDACVTIMRGDHDHPPRSVVPRADSASAFRAPVVTCRLCALRVPRVEALVIEGRGFVCAGCCGEVEASLAQRRVEVGGKD